MALFKKNKTDSDNGGPNRDPDKARAWFERAAAVADTRQYDYAIECFISGLRHDPGNQTVHEDLRDVALKRKVGGGKPAGLTEKFKSSGGGPVDKFLDAEKLWVKDPLNLKLMIQTMKLAVAADEASPDDSLGEVAYWIGNIVLENTQSSKSPEEGDYLALLDMFKQIGAFEKAVLACKLAIQVNPKNTQMMDELKDLEAESTLQKGRYTDTDGDFRDSVRDVEKQRQLAQEDAITKTASAVEQIIERRRAEYEQEPTDMDRLHKLVDALLQNESEPTENEASQLIQKAHEQTGQYRYKVRFGDLRMKQLNRQYRQARADLDKDKQNAEARAALEAVYKEKMKFELAEYTDRVQNYPTDLALKFQLGTRLYAFKKYDDAIGAFQQAKSDPKHRAASHDYLGRCYQARGWFDEAVDTFRQGIEIHPIADDRLGKELRYQLMAALENAAGKNKSLEQGREAQKIASQLLQTDIHFRDIRTRIDQVRTLVEKLQEEA